MIKTMLLPGLLPIAALAACATTDTSVTGSSPVGTVALTSATGASAGTATLTREGNAIVLSANVTGLAAGIHGAHLHTTGRCDAPKFTSAGPHLNPMGTQHGTMNPAGPHVGDLPNLTITSGGSGTLTGTLPGTASEVEARLFDADGTALVIHAGPDDYRTDPSGNSGARIACGIVTRG